MVCAPVWSAQGDFDDARVKYVEAMNTLGYQGDLAYNIALCYYKQKQYGPALKHIAEIIEVRGGGGRAGMSGVVGDARPRLRCMECWPS